MADETRGRVLAAAGPIFAEKGFDAATVREICDAASVNVASINYHFGDKKSLYLETVQLAHQLRVKQVPHPIVAADAPIELKLRKFVTTLLSRMIGVNAQPWQSRLMMREVIHPTEACRPMVEDYFRPQLEQLEGILSEALPAELPAHRLRHYAFSVIGQCLFYRVSQEVVELLTGPDERRHYRVEILADHITNFTLLAIGVSDGSREPTTLRTLTNK